MTPGDPLPAPQPDETPARLPAPEPLFTDPASDTALGDEMIQWAEASWLDERFLPVERSVPPAVGEVEGHDLEPDWIDRLDRDGLPEPDSDPLAAPVGLPAITVEPLDRFELIWPTGEVDEQFGVLTDTTGIGRAREYDRAGPTARLGRDPESPWQPGADTAGEPGAGEGPAAFGRPVDTDDIDDEVVLAVRRAVASIETGSLAARRRLVDPATQPQSHPDLVPPGRVAARSDAGVGTPEPGRTATSVFDDAPEIQLEPTATATTDDDDAASSTGRESALRRLIGSLRRR